MKLSCFLIFSVALGLSHAATSDQDHRQLAFECPAEAPDVATSLSTVPDVLDRSGDDSAWVYAAEIPMFKASTTNKEILGRAYILYDCASDTWFVKAQQDYPLQGGYCGGNEDCDHFVKMNGGGVLADPHNDGSYFEDNTGWEVSFPGSRKSVSGIIDLQVHANVYEDNESQTSGTSNDDNCDSIQFSCSNIDGPVDGEGDDLPPVDGEGDDLPPVDGEGAALPPVDGEGDDLPPDTDTRTGSNGGSGGDPHIKLWSNQSTGETAKFDYHGECDLVLVDNPQFANGLGLKLHLRTTRVRYFSYISRAALQIGSDTFEFTNDVDNWLLNGEIQTDGKATISGFEVRKYKRAVSVRLMEAAKAKIDFYSRKNGMMYVHVDSGTSDMFQGSLGLMGEYGTGRMISRSGHVESDTEAFALSWQVRDTEPMLFQHARAPQYPATCIPPEKILGNRLGDSHMKQAAEEACEGWGKDKDDCIFDVMATRDISASEKPSLVDVEDMLEAAPVAAY